MRGSRRIRRSAAVGSLLVAASLLLSGCYWAIYDHREDGGERLTLTRDFTNRLIWSCTADRGLERIGGSASSTRSQGSVTRFQSPTSTRRTAPQSRITATGRDGGRNKNLILFGAQGCLTYWFNPPPCVTDCRPPRHWWWAPLGSRSCVQGGA